MHTSFRCRKTPARSIFYLGGGLLCLTLSAVFFFSHQRIWALVEERGEGNYEVVLGGNTNRNALGFSERFKRLVSVDNRKTSRGK